MSAVPRRVPEIMQGIVQHSDAVAERWPGINAQLILQQLQHAGREGAIVLAAEVDQLHPAVQSLFKSSIVLLPALIYGAKSTGGNAVDVKPGIVPGVGAHRRYPLLIVDALSISAQDIHQLLLILPASLPVVLLHAEQQSEAGEKALAALKAEHSNIVFSLSNDGQLAASWSEFQRSREHNRSGLIVLDYSDSGRARSMQQVLAARNFQTVNATQRAATTFAHSTVGSQLLLIEYDNDIDQLLAYIRQLRQSHASDLLGIMVIGELQQTSERCALLKVGADELVDSSISCEELQIRLQALSHRQLMSHQIRHDAYRFPGSDAFSSDYLMNVGSTLYASAQRDVISMALAVIRVEFVETDAQATVTLQEQQETIRSIARYCGKNLRETDLFAQSGERDFIALVTCVGRHNIESVFKRLSLEVGELVKRASEGRIQVRLETGATCELGVSFRSMIERAQMALSSAQQSPDRSMVVR